MKTLLLLIAAIALLAAQTARACPKDTSNVEYRCYQRAFGGDYPCERIVTTQCRPLPEYRYFYSFESEEALAHRTAFYPKLIYGSNLCQTGYTYVVGMGMCVPNAALTQANPYGQYYERGQKKVPALKPVPVVAPEDGNYDEKLGVCRPKPLASGVQ